LDTHGPFDRRWYHDDQVGLGSKQMLFMLT
jgi:hypothetical protein